MRTSTAVGAALALAAGGFFGSWVAASASSLEVEGGVLQTWSYPVDLAVQPAPIEVTQPAATIEAPPVETTDTVDPADSTAEDDLTGEEPAPASEPAGDAANATATP